jgi:uncharacterized protein
VYAGVHPRDWESRRSRKVPTTTGAQGIRRPSLRPNRQYGDRVERLEPEAMRTQARPAGASAERAPAQVASESSSARGSHLTADVLRLWAKRALGRLGEAREQIDALNVFPVPDGDTGTNVFLTFEAAARAVAAAPATTPLGVLSRLMARAALLGARGNSGVILSQQLRGLGHSGVDGDAVDAQALASVLRAMADAGYSAVEEPREGTMLTVARDAATAATTAAADGASIGDVAVAAADAARASLARTPDLLEVLREAGVVDSGGAAVVVLLDALAEVATGRPRADIDLPEASGVGQAAALRAYAGPEFEVMYLLDAPDESIPSLRTRLAALGDSLVVVGGEGLWNVHVHVDDAGAAIDAALEVGRPHRIRITTLEESALVRERMAGALQVRGVVVAALGPGTVRLLQESGATPVVPAQGLRPSTEELIAGIHACRAREVILMPSDADTLAAAAAAAQHARAEGLRVAVVPTRSIVQSLSAVAVHEPAVDFEADVIGMTRAAGATRYGSVTVATREAMTSAGRCRPGDVLGVVAGEILEIGASIVEVTQRLLDRLLVTDAELVTLIRGLDLKDEEFDAIVDWAGREHRSVEVAAHVGDQPVWPVLLGVE